MASTLKSRLRAIVHAQPAAPRALAVQAAGMLLLAGGLLALVTVLLPPPAEGSEWRATEVYLAHFAVTDIARGR